MKKTTGIKSFTAVMTLALALMLSACSDNSGTPELTASPTTSPATTDQPGSPQPSLEPSDAPGNNETPQQTEEPSGNDTGSANGDGKGEEAGAQAAALAKLVKLAKEGKVPGTDYAAHLALFDEIEKSWGKPDVNETAGKGIYATYKEKGITFGYNKGMKVFDVRSYADELHAITLKQIEQALGKPDETAVSGEDDIYVYQVNEQYQLKFIIPQSGKGVDHISVFSPSDAKNNMAG